MKRTRFCSRLKPIIFFLLTGVTVFALTLAMVCVVISDEKIVRAAFGREYEPLQIAESGAQPQAAAQTPGQQASIEGLVVNSLTGKALEGAHLTLVAISSEMRPEETYGAMSNEAGLFSINPIRAKTYLITVERKGFIFVPVRGKGGALNNMVVLKPGQAVRNFRLEMTPKAVISGLVFDEYGEPMEGVSVQAVAVKPGLVNPLGGMEYGGNSTTNDRGEFRISSPPGKYYIKAASNPPSGNGPPEVRTDGTVETIYRETYYPGAASVEAAEPVEVQAGGVLTGVRFQLLHSPALNISGRVSEMPEGAGPLYLTIASHHSQASHSSSFSSGSNEKPDLQFNFGPLAPGVYQIFAQCPLSSERWQSQIAEINLTDTSVDNITLVLTPGSELMGTVETLGPSAGALEQSGQRFVTLQPHDTLSTGWSLTAAVAGDGSFKIKNVPAGRYGVGVQPLPGNWYIKSLHANKTALSNGVLDLRNGAEGVKLKITLSTNGGQLSGHVQDKEEHAGYLPIVVMLWPEGDNVFPQRVQSDKTDPNGAYSFKGLSPGKYRLFALDPLGSGGTEFADLIKQYGAAVEVIEIKEGDTISRDLKILTRGSMEKRAKP